MTRTDIEAVVIVRFDEAGEIEYYVSGKRACLFIVDERCPHDRVYEYTSRVAQSDIGEILGKSEIGHSRDRRHAAIEAKVIAAMDGKRTHLSVVTQED